MANKKRLIKKIQNWQKQSSKRKVGARHNSTKAAKILFEVISTYKPTLYDVFGYDFSGKRRRLIETFVEDPHDNCVDKYYGDELIAMKKSRLKGRLTQELKFGLLINKIIDDLGMTLRSKKLHDNVDWSVIKIAKASRTAYKDYKKTHPLHRPCKNYKKNRLITA